MNFVLVSHNLQCGGAERVIVNLANYLTVKGHAVSIICFNDKRAHYSLDNRIAVHVLRPQKKKASKINKIMKYLQLRKLVRRFKPNAVVAFQAGLGGLVKLVLLGTGIKVISSERADPSQRQLKHYKKYIVKPIFEASNGFIFQTKQAMEFYNPKIRERSSVIPNPVWIDDAKLAEYHVPCKRDVIVGMGRLTSQKNFELLIRAFDRIKDMFPSYTLEIYGEGNLKEQLVTLIAERGLHDRVRLMGITADVVMVFLSAQIFVLSSNFEGMPNVLLEAMSCNTPCIATDCPAGGPAALITHGENGLLFPVGDEDALVHHLQDLLSDDALASRLGSCAGNIRKALHSDIVMGQWESFLKKIAES